MADNGREKAIYRKAKGEIVREREREPMRQKACPTEGLASKRPAEADDEEVSHYFGYCCWYLGLANVT